MSISGAPTVAYWLTVEHPEKYCEGGYQLPEPLYYIGECVDISGSIYTPSCYCPKTGNLDGGIVNGKVIKCTDS